MNDLEIIKAKIDDVLTLVYVCMTIQSVTIVSIILWALLGAS